MTHRPACLAARPRLDRYTALAAPAAITAEHMSGHHYVPADQAAALLAGGCGCGDGRESAASFAVDADSPPGPVTWSGPIGMEGQMTGDGRIIEDNALFWEDLPLPLRHAPVDNGAHDGAVVVGRILSITRKDDGVIWATGDFDTESEEGREALRQVEKGLTPGVSMDLDTVSFEVRVAAEVVEDLATPLEDDATREKDADGRVTVLDIEADSEVMVTTEARIRAATVVAIPAFSKCRITVDAQTEGDTTEDATEQEAVAAGATVTPLVAAAAIPMEPPAEWFTDPGLSEPTALVVTDQGRVFGHLATWGTCHTAYPGQCVEPPRSSKGYAYFTTGSVLTAEGTEVPVGVITMDTLHAGRALRPAETLAHYENTGTAIADVAVGEDAFGIYVAGALRPTATAEQIRSLRASPLSGDWRRIGGNLELVGALAVNVPGFPIPRPQGLVASGVMTSLVASGMLPPHKVIPPGQPGALSTDDLRYLKRLIARERTAEEHENTATAQALAARVARVKVKAMAGRLGL